MTKDRELFRDIVARYGQVDSSNLIRQLDFFEEDILDYKDTAVELWNEFIEKISEIEHTHQIKQKLIENIKLYAIAPLILCDALGINKSDARKIASVFNVYYLLVHLFDDHVEHRDKFHSKFTYSTSIDETSQQGATPFTIVLSCIKYLLQAGIPVELVESIVDSILELTQYITIEKKRFLSPEEVFDIKESNVSGEATKIIFTIASTISPQMAKAIPEHAYRLLGCLEQITDDIRDRVTDETLKNANLLSAVAATFGEEHLAEHIVDKYFTIHDSLNTLLESSGISKPMRNRIESIPFYPFMIHKEELRRG